MKKHFLTGLIILLPIAVTIALVMFIVNFLTHPFVGIVEHFFERYQWFESYRGLVHIGLKIVMLFVLIFLTLLLGFLARIVVFKSMLSLYDYLLHRIPFIKTIYKASQQVIKTIFGSSSRSFKQVVMVKFPKDGSYCLGLISGPAPTVCSSTLESPLTSVFIPTAPNPTSGFLLICSPEEIVYLDMKVDEAFKYIISCGVIQAES